MRFRARRPRGPQRCADRIESAAYLIASFVLELALEAIRVKVPIFGVEVRSRVHADILVEKDGEVCKHIGASIVAGGVAGIGVQKTVAPAETELRWASDRDATTGGAR